MRFQSLPATFHSTKRKQLREAMPQGSIAIIDTADILSRGDFEYPYHPDPNFYYLTGISEPEDVLVVISDKGTKTDEILFLAGTTEMVGTWNGDRLTSKEATKLSGIAAVYPLSDLDFFLDRLLSRYSRIYLNSDESLRSLHNSPSLRRAQTLKARMPLHQIDSATAILANIRTIKDKPEIDQITRAIQVTEAGLQKAITNLRPGMKEYELEALLISEYISGGAQGHGFSPIVASGHNATIMHYEKNDKVISKSDLVLIDTSADVGWYAADITRTVPASGRFTPRQKAIYEAVYGAQQMAISLYKPGENLFSVNEKIQDSLLRDLVKLGVLTSAEATGRDAQAHLHKFYPTISHHLGLDVHDTGGSRLEFKPGMVVTCEPGLYIKDEGIGIRIEDDVLITAGEPKVLSAGIPADPDSIEKLME